MTIKPGVDARNLRPEILLAIQEAREVFRKYGLPLVITSLLDGTHMKDSKHHDGLAVDFRTRHLDPQSHAPVAEAINKALGPQYDVVLEKNHIHVEFDPKGDV